MEVLVPIIKEVDVLVIGSILSGCELSLYLRQAGRRVLVTSSGPGLGDDVVGRLERTEHICPTLGNLAGTPVAIQAQLDRLFLDAGVEFLFGAIPIRPLYENRTHRLAGWVFFGGSHYFAIASKAVVDGTCDGILPFQMRLNRRSTGIAECPVHWNLIGECRPPEDISDANLEVSLVPLNADGQTAAFCQYRRSFRLRQNDTAGILHAEMLLRKDALTPNTICTAYWPKFEFSNHAWDGIETSQELPLYRAGTANVPMLLQETIPGIPLAKEFQDIECRQPPADCQLVWKNHLLRPTSCLPRISLTLDSLATDAPAWNAVVVGTGPDAFSAARTAAQKGLNVLLLASSDIPADIFLDLANSGVEIWCHVMVGGVLMRQHDVAGVLVIVDNGTTCLVHTTFVIDATGCGAIAAGTGAPMHHAHEPEPITHNSVVAPRIPSDPFGNPEETHYFPNDPWDTTRAFVLAQLRAQGHFVMEPPRPREDQSRILGEVTLLPQDFVLGYHYEDTIATSQGFFPNPKESCHPLLWMEDLQQVQLAIWIPFRAILPLRVDGMIVLGKALSAHRDATCACVSEELLSREGIAAALLASHALKSGSVLRRLDLHPVQQELVSLGMLPPEVLTAKEDAQPPNDLSLAAIYRRPDQARRILQARFELEHDLRTALILAFLGDSSGRALLAKALCDTREQDDTRKFCTLVSAITTIGGSQTEMLKKLADLTPQTAFQSLRILCHFFQRWPSREATHPLRRLLEEHQISLSLQDSGLAATIHAMQDGTIATRLKCLYLAAALHACAPEDSEANDFLEKSRHSWSLQEALFAWDAGK